MEVEIWKLEDIKPYAKNPRHNEGAVDAVAASIKEFGFRQPLVVDEEGTIVVGDTRHKAARKLGLEEVPVHVARGLSPAQLKAYRIADNKTGELADWDQERLVHELAELQALDFTLDLLGFPGEELLELMSGGAADGLAAIPMTSRSHRTRPSRSRVTCGCWASIGYCAATPPNRKTWIACWRGPTSNWLTAIRRTMSAWNLVRTTQSAPA